MDAAVIAALIAAGAKLTPTIVDRAKALLGKNKGLSGEQYYAHLRPLLTDNCFRALKVAEDGQNHRAHDFVFGLYKNKALELIKVKSFLAEFEYRIRFLLALQLLDSSNSNEYRITNAGRQFMAMARQHNDYVLADREPFNPATGNTGVANATRPLASGDQELIERMLDALHDFRTRNPEKTWMTAQTLAIKAGRISEERAIELLRRRPEVQFGNQDDTGKTLIKLSNKSR
jgi:hypothetical protein